MEANLLYPRAEQLHEFGERLAVLVSDAPAGVRQARELFVFTTEFVDDGLPVSSGLFSNTTDTKPSVLHCITLRG